MMVGRGGFEPPTCGTQNHRATGLRQRPLFFLAPLYRYHSLSNSLGDVFSFSSNVSAIIRRCENAASRETLSGAVERPCPAIRHDGIYRVAHVVSGHSRH